MEEEKREKRRKRKKGRKREEGKWRKRERRKKREKITRGKRGKRGKSDTYEKAKKKKNKNKNQKNENRTQERGREGKAGIRPGAQRRPRALRNRRGPAAPGCAAPRPRRNAGERGPGRGRAGRRQAASGRCHLAPAGSSCAGTLFLFMCRYVRVPPLKAVLRGFLPSPPFGGPAARITNAETRGMVKGRRGGDITGFWV